MKTIFTFLCLLLSGVWAEATVQTTVSQDKTTRFYLKSYSLGGGGGASFDYNYSWLTYNGYYSTGPTNTANAFENIMFNYNLNWSDGVAGAGSWMYRNQFGNSIWGTPPPLFDNVNWTWPAGNWPNTSANQIGSMIEANNALQQVVSNGVWVTVSDDYVSTSQQAPPVQEEYCNVNVSPPDYYGYSDFYGNHQVPVSASIIRTAQTVMKLQVGGKSMAGSKSLFKCNVSATQLSPEDPFLAFYDYGEGYSYMSEGNYVANVPPQSIAVGSCGTANGNGVLYVSAAAGDNLDVTPYVPGVNYYSFNETMTPVQTKADWQAVVQNEIDNDSGVQIETYAAANGFMTNRANIQSVYAFYQKVFDEQPTWYYWAGLAKLAGAPVYAGLSDAEYGRIGSILSGPLVSGLNAPFTTLAGEFQTNLIQMNIAVYSDLTWQFEAYRKCGLNALEYVYSTDSLDLDLNAITAWRMINQGIEQNNTTNIQTGNKQLLQREQQQILQQGYVNLANIFPGTTSLMSIFAQNPVIGGPTFSSLEPGGNLATFSYRWDWVSRPFYNITNTGILPLWLQESSATRLGDAAQPLLTRAQNNFSLVYEYFGFPIF